MDRIRQLRQPKPDDRGVSPEEADKETSSLFRKTQDAVKEVQRRYHGRQDIATGNDPSVGILCTQLEQVMLNGLRQPKKRDSEHTFWPAIQQILTDEDTQALSYLTNITTDSGRARAWIRWALNERTLEMYLGKLMQARSNLGHLYYDLAFVLDADKMEMLLGLTQGLESVVFALDVDLVELNTVNKFQVKHIQEPPPAAKNTTVWQTLTSTQSNNDAPAVLSPDAFAPVPTAQFRPAADFDPMDAVAAAEKKRKKKKKKGKNKDADIGVWGEEKLSSAPSSTAPVADDDSEPPSVSATTSVSSEPKGSAGADFGIPSFDTAGSSSYDNAFVDDGATPSFSTFLPSAKTHSTSIPDGSAAVEEDPRAPQFDAAPAATTNHHWGDDAVTNAPPSPGTIARNALAAARRSSVTASSAMDTPATSTVVDTSFEPDDLRSVLVGVMRNKGLLEEEVRTLEGKLETANHEIEELRRANTELHERASNTNSAPTSEATQTALAKENELLKMQLKKYVAENNQLKRASRAILEGAGVDPSGVPAADSTADRFFSDDGDAGETDESVGDFKSIEDMQAHYETQILKVTQMHCEVMELNDRLHEQLRSRDRQVQALGGIVPDDSGRPAVKPRKSMDHARPARLAAPTQPLSIAGKNTVVNIWIPAALLRGKGSESYHVYQIYCHVGQDEWNVYRRYTHFADLHRQVTSIFQGVKIQLPKKRTLNRKGAKFVEERRQQLEQYIRYVVQLCLQSRRSPMATNPCKQTFCEALPFLQEKLSSSTTERQSSTVYGGF